MKTGDKYKLADGSGEAVVTEISDDRYFAWCRVTAMNRRGLFPFRCSDGQALAHESYGMPGLKVENETDLEF